MPEEATDPEEDGPDLSDYGWEPRNCRRYRKPVPGFPPLVLEDAPNISVRASVVRYYASVHQCSERKARKRLRGHLREALAERTWGMHMHDNRWRIAPPHRRGEPKHRLELSVDMREVARYYLGPSR
ncbi:hypothetical protein ACFPC0_10875 [Streptomyces andamanensis]|uniref:Uncharacterized protein n=1 Tax=Streptomyces andamanensis TaxID=1565035 RepID=A0ABV8TCM5_9ACTN